MELEFWVSCRGLAWTRPQCVICRWNKALFLHEHIQRHHAKQQQIQRNIVGKFTHINAQQIAFAEIAGFGPLPLVLFKKEEPHFFGRVLAAHRAGSTGKYPVVPAQRTLQMPLAFFSAQGRGMGRRAADGAMSHVPRGKGYGCERPGHPPRCRQGKMRCRQYRRVALLGIFFAPGEQLARLSCKLERG